MSLYAYYGPSKNHVYTNTVFVILSTLLLYCCNTNAHIQCVYVSLSTTNSIIEIISGPSKRSCSLSLSLLTHILVSMLYILQNCVYVHTYIAAKFEYSIERAKKNKKGRNNLSNIHSKNVRNAHRVQYMMLERPNEHFEFGCLVARLVDLYI